MLVTLNELSEKYLEIAKPTDEEIRVGNLVNDITKDLSKEKHRELKKKLLEFAKIRRNNLVTFCIDKKLEKESDEKGDYLSDNLINLTKEEVLQLSETEQIAVQILKIEIEKREKAEKELSDKGENIKLPLSKEEREVRWILKKEKLLRSERYAKWLELQKANKKEVQDMDPVADSQEVHEKIKNLLSSSSNDSNKNDTLDGTGDLILQDQVNAIIAKPVQTENNKNLVLERATIISSEVYNVLVTKKIFSIKWLMSIFVLLPTLLVFFYFMFFASPMYISNTKFSIQSSKNNIVPFNIASILLGDGGRTTSDNYLVLEYLQSLVLVKEVDLELDIINHYSNKSYDIISRLSLPPTNSTLLNYWSWIVTTGLDSESGIIDLEVKAYTPEMAQKISEILLNKVELLINKMNIRLQEDSIKLAQHELEISEEKVNEAQNNMRLFREAHITFDPAKTASGIQARIVALEGEYTKLQTELTAMLSVMKSDAPQIKLIENRLKAIQNQLEVENAKVVGAATDNSTMSAVVAEYEQLMTDLKFAKNQQLAAMKALEVARVQSLSQGRYVVYVQQPTLPDESLYPTPFLFTIYTLLGTLLGLGLISLVVAAIREHTGF